MQDYSDRFAAALFWARVNGSNVLGCWPWLGRTNDSGYGRYKSTMAHRAAFQFVYGEINDNDVVRHSCDNPICCNPRHLSNGTQQDNMQDAVDRKRVAFGQRNGRTSLSPEDVARIRRNPGGLSGKDLAETYGVAQSTISYIRSGRSWKYSGG